MSSRRPALYHPYKTSVPRRSPAGFRIADYINPRRCFNLFQGTDFTNTRPPAPSPLNSPLKSPRHPNDDAPPTLRLADLFAHGFGSPNRPSPTGPHDHRNATPKATDTNVPAQDPLPMPPRRQEKRGPKHLSFSSGAIRPGIFPPHRRGQRMKEKRENSRSRILDRHERRIVRARESLSRLRREANMLMRPEHMSDEDKIFLEQLEKLEFDQRLEHDLEQCRQRMARAAAEAPMRKLEHAERDAAAAKLWGERQDKEALEQQKRKVAEFVRAIEEQDAARFRRMEEAAMRVDEQRQRAHESRERRIRQEQERLFRQELARKAQEEEHKKRKERERQLREERERKLREERERKLREEMERQKYEEELRKLREAREHIRRFHEARERSRREERERFARQDREREAAFLAEQARRAAAQKEEQTQRHFALYEGKWNELRTNTSLPPIDVREMPWPVFGVVSSAEQITHQGVRAFMFHPQRPGVEGKTARDMVKAEMLRFHPDKFNTRVLPRIYSSQQAVAQAIAGAVARILTSIMTEVAEQ